MKTHTIEGQFMLDRVGGLLARVGEIVRSCHERWDGKGYPDGLRRRGDSARRPHRLRLRRLQRDDDRPPLPRRHAAEAALEELLANAGTQFDPTRRRPLVAGRRRGRAEPAPTPRRRRPRPARGRSQLPASAGAASAWPRRPSGGRRRATWPRRRERRRSPATTRRQPAGAAIIVAHADRPTTSAPAARNAKREAPTTISAS